MVNPEEYGAGRTISRVKVSRLVPSDINPRKSFDQAELKELAENIKKNGMLAPIIVRPSKAKKGKLEVVAGERRLRAAVMAKIDEVDVDERVGLDDQGALEIMLAENLMREDLKPLEVAEALKRFVDAGFTQQEVAKRIGKSQSYVSARIRMLELPETTMKLVAQEKVTVEQATAMLPYAGTPAIERIERGLRNETDTFGRVSNREFKEDILVNALNDEDVALNLETIGWNNPELKAAFDLKACEKCPERRDVPGQYGPSDTHKACLKKECWESKLKEAKKQIRLKHMEQNKAKKEKDAKDGVLNVTSRSSATYATFHKDRWDRPSFDTGPCGRCADHRKAKSQYQDGTFYICTNPDCFNAKQKEAKGAIELLRRGIAIKVAENIEKRTKGPKELAPNELRLIIVELVTDTQHDEKLKSVFGPWVSKTPKKGWKAAVNQVPDDALPMVLLRAAVIHELLDIKRGQDADVETPLTAFTASLLDGAVMSIKEPRKDKCKSQEVSKANGGLYCKKDKGGAYCIEDPGSRGSAFECPEGRPRVYLMEGEKPREAPAAPAKRGRGRPRRAQLVIDDGEGDESKFEDPEDD